MNSKRVQQAMDKVFTDISNLSTEELRSWLDTVPDKWGNILLEGGFLEPSDGELSDEERLGMFPDVGYQGHSQFINSLKFDIENTPMPKMRLRSDQLLEVNIKYWKPHFYNDTDTQNIKNNHFSSSIWNKYFEKDPECLMDDAGSIWSQCFEETEAVAIDKNDEWLMAA